MNEPHELSEEDKEPLVIFHVVAVAVVIAWPFLCILLGYTYGSFVGYAAIYAAERYLKAQRRKVTAAPIAYQRYVARCAKRFFLARIIPAAGVACFLNQPHGLIYFLAISVVSVGEVMWESAKLGDMEAKVPNQTTEPSSPSLGGSS